MKYRFFDAESLMTNPNYNPDLLLNTTIAQKFLKNDAALCRALEVAPPIVSKIRHRRLPVGAWMLMRIHHLTKTPIDDLRVMMGDTVQVDDGNPPA